MRVSGERQRNSRNAIAGEFGLGEKRRQAGDDQDHHRPRREREQQDRVADQRDRVLHEAEGSVDQAQRTARRLAPRPRQLVVELGVLEVRQLQRQRFFQDHDVDALAEQGAQQRLARRNAALAAATSDDDARFEHDQPQHALRVGVRRVHGGDHAVDNQLADVGNRGRQHAGDDGQQRRA